MVQKSKFLVSKALFAGRARAVLSHFYLILTRLHRVGEVRQDPEAEVQEVVEKEIIPRRLVITMRELEKYGFTPGCRACERKRRGELAKTRHSVVCRRRVEEKMNQDEQGKATLDATKQKFAKFTARLIEKEEAKKRKAETQAGNVDDMAIEDDKAEDVEVAEARR